MEFRTLFADEIECRVATVSEKGCSLLLYKDARADMNLLDETVGCENWQRSHVLINGNLFCNVSIKLDGEWVTKQDVGTESYTEKEKGQASDSFKRACVNWGIGRELYTAPFIWVSNCEIANKNGKPTTYDRFAVDYISYDSNRNICELRIVNAKTKAVVYEFKNKQGSSAPKKETILTGAKAKTEVLKILNSKSQEYVKNVLDHYKIKEIKEITVEIAEDFLKSVNSQ
jgi:hypothetical protein